MINVYITAKSLQNIILLASVALLINCKCLQVLQFFWLFLRLFNYFTKQSLWIYIWKVTKFCKPILNYKKFLFVWSICDWYYKCIFVPIEEYDNCNFLENLLHLGWADSILKFCMIWKLYSDSFLEEIIFKFWEWMSYRCIPEDFYVTSRW